MKKILCQIMLISALLVTTSATASSLKHRSTCHIKLVHNSYAVYIGNFLVDLFPKKSAALDFVHRLVAFKICKPSANFNHQTDRLPLNQ